MNKKIFHTSLVIIFIVLTGTSPAHALKLSEGLKKALSKNLPITRIRIDGAVETKGGILYLPAIPIQEHKTDTEEPVLKAVFPKKGSPELVVFGNGWCFLKVLGSAAKGRTLVSLEKLPPELQTVVLATRLPSDLIVPDKFVIPNSLKTMAGAAEVSVNGGEAKKQNAISMKVSTIADENKAIKIIDADAVLGEQGGVLVSSLATGKISLLTYPEMIKVTEFPIEGTPSGMAYANGKVYIADQSKARILKLDPYNKKFIGQIDLPRGSTPKDVVALPDGKLIYVSENAAGDVAVFETATDKLLVRTKVHNSPGRLAVEPNGTMCVVLSVPDGRASLISTQTQRFISTVPVGSLPNSIAFDENGKFAFVSNRLSNTVAIIDLLHRGVVFNLKTGTGPTGLAIDGEKLYVANAKENSISVFNTVSHKKLDDIRLPLDIDFPGALIMMPDKQHILVTSESTDALALLDITNQTFEKPVIIGHTTDQGIWLPAKQ